MTQAKSAKSAKSSKSIKSTKSKSTKSATRVRRTNTAPKSATKSTSTGTRARKSASGTKQVTIDRRRNAGRRRKDNGSPAKSTKTEAKPENPGSNPAELESSTLEDQKLERRQKVNRRRQIDPTTCERDYTAEEIEFMNALDDYKRKSGRMFPTCSEVLEVIRTLGYVQLTHAERMARSQPEMESAEVPAFDLEKDADRGAEPADPVQSRNDSWATIPCESSG